ncbi:MAG: hypothetical protein GY851_09285 [bacterium]|nr:hypothetical protein [bacterium]
MMRKYHKIHAPYYRDDKGRLMPGKWARPEFEMLADCMWTATEKIDGTNIRIGWDGAAVEFGGRTDRAQIPAHLVNRLRELFPVERFEDLPPMVVFGEGYGHKIQAAGDSYNDEECDFICFDVWCGDVWLEPDNVSSVAARLGLRVVPTVAALSLWGAFDFVGKFPASQIGDIESEGLVLRAPMGMLDRQGHRIITKIKARDIRRMS